MNLGNALGIPEDVFRYVPDNRFILPECRLGVEFEFEGVRTTWDKMTEGWGRYWQIHRDNSLHDNGLEWAFSKPLFGRDAAEAIIKLCEYAQKNKFKVTIRTGLHVHVDVRDLTRDELVRLNVLYALFERGLYRVAGHNREENVFCLPWYKADRMQDHVNNINSPNYDIKEASEALENEKYGGLNLDSLARFGSVEFRMALATTDTEWVFRWINLCLSFKRAAKKLNASPLEILHNLSGVGVENFARQVFEDQFDTIWYPELDAQVWAVGVETAMSTLPRAKTTIDKASLSWNNRVGAIPEGKVNERFKRYVAKHAKPKPNTPIDPVVNVDIEADINPFRLNRRPLVAEWPALEPRPNDDIVIDEE